MKKPYQKPVIVRTEVIESRATVCAKSGEPCRANGGPIWS